MGRAAPSCVPYWMRRNSAGGLANAATTFGHSAAVEPAADSTAAHIDPAPATAKNSQAAMWTRWQIKGGRLFSLSWLNARPSCSASNSNDPRRNYQSSGRESKPWRSFFPGWNAFHRRLSHTAATMSRSAVSPFRMICGGQPLAASSRSTGFQPVPVLPQVANLLYGRCTVRRRRQAAVAIPPTHASSASPDGSGTAATLPAAPSGVL